MRHAWTERGDWNTLPFIEIYKGEIVMFKKRTPSQAQKKALGRIFREARNNCGLTQEELAEIMNCSTRWLIQVEGGKSSLNCVDTIRLMSILKLDPVKVAEEVGILVPGSSSGA